MPRQPAKPYRRPRPEAPDPRFAPLPAAEAGADAPAPAASTATDLSVQPQTATAQSPAARTFRREMAKLDRLKTQLAELQRQGRAHQLQSHEMLRPLRDEHRACMRQLAWTLDPWLDVRIKGLSKLQQQTALTIVCHLSAELAHGGDAEMAALHDRRSPRTLADRHETEADKLHDLIGRLHAELFGTEAPADLDTTNPEAALERLQAMAAEQEERRQAKAEARKARRKPGASEQQARQSGQDADAMLRGIYRQLASALHPDRAPDEAERRRKNTLMGEVNAAYGRKDLVTLLNLQLQAELVDPDHLERIPDQRLQSLTLLLRRQVAELERERQSEQERWWHDLQLPWGASLDATALRQRLEDERDALEQRLHDIRLDLNAAAELATLKPWLNEQRRLTREAERRQRLMADVPFRF